MRSGPLRHRVEIQKPIETQGDDRTITTRWSTIARRFAAIEPLTGRELQEAQQVQARISVRIRMRFFSDLIPAHRIKHGTTIYEIAAPINVDGRNREHHLMCVETA
jgi:SPP1 family predicted phage head-tail adaptor